LRYNWAVSGLASPLDILTSSHQHKGAGSLRKITLCAFASIPIPESAVRPVSGQRQLTFGKAIDK